MDRSTIIEKLTAAAAAADRGERERLTRFLDALAEFNGADPAAGQWEPEKDKLWKSLHALTRKETEVAALMIMFLTAADSGNNNNRKEG